MRFELRSYAGVTTASFFIVLVMHSLVTGPSTFAEGGPADATQGSGRLPSVVELVALHESGSAGFEAVKANWTLEFLDSRGDTSEIQRFNSVVAPGFERTTQWNEDERSDVFWNGESYERMLNYNEEATDFASAAKVKAFKLEEPILGSFHFHWRALREHRFLTTDEGLSLRQIVEYSSEEPKLSKIDGLFRIDAKLGGPSLNGTPLCSDYRVEVDIDPALSYAIVAQRGYCLREGVVNIQSMTAESFVKLGTNFHLPEVVRTKIYSEPETESINQITTFKYFDFNVEIDYSRNIFPANVIVREMKRLGDEKPENFFVTGPGGTLGRAYENGEDAINELGLRFHGDATRLTAKSSEFVLLALGFVFLAGLLVFAWCRKKVKA